MYRPTSPVVFVQSRRTTHDAQEEQGPPTPHTELVGVSTPVSSTRPVVARGSNRVCCRPKGDRSLLPRVGPGLGPSAGGGAPDEASSSAGVLSDEEELAQLVHLAAKHGELRAQLKVLLLQVEHPQRRLLLLDAA